jgi:hypothetical protein
MITEHQKYNSTINGKAKRLFLNKRRSCQNKNIPFDLDEKWVLKRIEVGCELTGVPFKLDSHYKPHAMSPSIDRLNSNYGYLKENCRMILHALNMFKGSDSEQLMFYIAEKLLDNKGNGNIFEDLEEKPEEKPNLSSHLSQLFTKRQIEIIFKKYNEEPLTKTEAEYYSRSIKKKLVAISNEKLFEIGGQILKEI